MPSLYETTAVVGDVESSNFTTLYNASGLTVPNAGAGTVSGNLNVGGNLTVQGTSLLQGAVTLGDTLCLPNYCLPLPDGTTYQVMTTDGSGNLYWSDVQSLPGSNYSIDASTTTGGANLNLSTTTTTDSVKFASGTGITVSRTDANTITITNTASTGTTYTIDASTTTGGANLNLVGSNSTTDSIKFAGGTNITVSRTDANTITISSSADDIPNGTARGQVLYWDGTQWTASSNIRSSAANDRLVLTYENASAGIASAGILRKDFSGFTYATGDGPGLGFQLLSNSQGGVQVGRVAFGYSATDPTFLVQSSTDNFVTPINILEIDKATGDLYAPELILNVGQTGSPTTNSTIRFNRGTSTDATLIWNETTDQFELSDPLSITNGSVPANFERQVTAGSQEDYELPVTIKLTERVTDAVNNNTDDGGPSVLFARTSGASGGAEKTYAQMGATYYGTTNLTDFRLNWSLDNFTESTPGVYPNSYTILRAGSNDAVFYNDSLFVDYSAESATKTATSITGGNTLVFGSAHGFTAGQRIKFTSTTQNGLTQDRYYYVQSAGLTATQCRIGLINGSTLSLTNGTGLTLIFATLVNRVGINTATPNSTLDVNGDAHVAANLAVDGDLYLSGYQIDLVSPTIGDMIYYNGTAFTNDNVISTTDANNRSVFEYRENSSTNRNSLFLRRDTGTTAYTNGNVTALGFQVESDSQPTLNTFASIRAIYDSTAPKIALYTSNDNFVSNVVDVARFDSSEAKLNGTNLILNANNTSAAVDGFFTVERGTTGADVALKWNETTDRWQFTNDGTTYYNIPINIDDLSDVVITPPASKGQVLYYDGSNWVNNSRIQFDSTTYRTTVQFNNSANSGQINSSLLLLKNTGASNYVSGDGTGMLIGVDDDANPTNVFAAVGAAYNSGGNHEIRLRSSNDNFTTSKNLLTANNDDVTVNGTEFIFNVNGTGAAAVDAQITVERGTTGADSYIKWNETLDRWEISNSLYAPSATIGVIDINQTTGQIDTNSGSNLTLDSDGGTVIVNDNLDVNGAIEVNAVATIDTNSFTYASVTPVAVASTAGNMLKVMIHMTLGTQVHCLEALALRTGALSTSTLLTTYAELNSSSGSPIANFTADIDSGNLRIIATPTTSSTVTFKVVEISVA